MDDKITLNEARAAVALQACITTLDAIAKEKYLNVEIYSGYKEAVLTRNAILGFPVRQDKINLLEDAQATENAP